ncbi:unnamed protein product [Diamesa tonsa]
MSFGAQPLQSTGFGGAALGTQSTGISFGAQTTSALPTFGTPAAQPPTFGTQASQLPTFGATAAQPAAFGATAQPPAFGAPAQPQGFGTPTQPQGFGAPAQGFGAPAQPQGFGSPAQPQAFGTVSQPQGFGSPAQPPAFGAQTTAATLSFGAQPTTSVAPLSFGQPAASVAPLSFGATTTPSLSLQTSTAATGFGFGAQTTATTSAPALSFSLPSASTATSTAAPLLGGIQFGGISTASTLPSLLNTGLATSTITPSTTIQASIGLGGIDVNSAQPKAVEGKNDATKVKETQVPKEIIATVEDIKSFIKQQKTLSSDIARTSTRKLLNVSGEIQNYNWSLQEIANNVDNNKTAIKLLRSDTSQIIQYADMAQRTHETPSGLQFENTLPQQYFAQLIHKYENDLITLKYQVELTEKHLHSLSNPQNFTAQDLKRGLQQIHESFVALAGRLQETHQKVEGQKEQYLNLRKYLLRDKSNPFEEDALNVGKQEKTQIAFGPNPFTNTHHMGFNMSNQSQTPTTGATANMNSTQFGNNTTSFGTMTSNSSLIANTTGFNLQQPPLGIKRNKF